MISTDFWRYRALPLPIISTPRQVGFFSELEFGKTVSFDASQLKAFHSPVVPMKITSEGLLPQTNDPTLESLNLSLKSGTDVLAISENAAKKENGGRLVEWILHNRERLRQSGVRAPSLRQCCEDAEFVCSRNVLTDLAFTPYGSSNEWALNVVRWHDVFFLIRAKSVASKPNVSNRQKRASGKKLTAMFRHLATCESGSKDDAVDNSTRFVAVNRADLTSQKNRSGHRLLYAGCIDCTFDSETYAMLKANKVTSRKDGWEKFYTFKILKLALKCCFMGVERLVIGFHDSSGNLSQIGEFEVDKIPELAESILGKKKVWKPAACMNFLDSFLSDLKERIRKNDISAVYQIRFVPRFHHGVKVESPGLQFERLVEVGVCGTGFEYLQSISEQFD